MSWIYLVTKICLDSVSDHTPAQLLAQFFKTYTGCDWNKAIQIRMDHNQNNCLGESPVIILTPPNSTPNNSQIVSDFDETLERQIKRGKDVATMDASTAEDWSSLYDKLDNVSKDNTKADSGYHNDYAWDNDSQEKEWPDSQKNNPSDTHDYDAWYSSDNQWLASKETDFYTDNWANPDNSKSEWPFWEQNTWSSKETMQHEWPDFGVKIILQDDNWNKQNVWQYEWPGF